jgi:hypothetical protein
MLNNLKFMVFSLIGALILSCNNNPKVKEIIKTSVGASVKHNDTTIVIDTTTDDLASFISGMPYNKNGCLSKVDSAAKWDLYANEIEKLFSRAYSLRFNKVKVWADSELIKNPTIKTLFYPFGGPDFLNADIFYPNADRYILIGLEPIGYLPDICNMIPDSVNSYLNSVNNSLKDIFKRSYFITLKMNKDLRKTKLNGTLPLLSFFIKRTGHQIVSIQRIAIDSVGKMQIIDSLKSKENVVTGVKVDFLSLSKDKVQSVYYFRTDLSDKGLAKKPGFKAYMSELPRSYTYLKAASYLMHNDNFKTIRSIIFNTSSSILQDDSGIAYKYFDKSEWNIKLYGKYSKPKDEFSFISEPDLEKAYKSSDYRPLPYSLGYNWGTDHTSMLYAIKK